MQVGGDFVQVPVVSHCLTNCPSILNPLSHWYVALAPILYVLATNEGPPPTLLFVAGRSDGEDGASSASNCTLLHA